VMFLLIMIESLAIAGKGSYGEIPRLNGA